MCFIEHFSFLTPFNKYSSYTETLKSILNTCTSLAEVSTRHYKSVPAAARYAKYAPIALNFIG